jgi:hypothetical protein
MPTADDIMAKANQEVGLGETPPGSNHNVITEWYGADGPWCAMFVSWVLAHAGFSTSGGATLSVPGIVQTTTHGWAYVPYLLNAFRTANRVVDKPAHGDIVAYDWDRDGVPDHTGLVDAVLADGTIWAVEGNHGHVVQRVHRGLNLIEAFCRPPYDGTPAPGALPALAAGAPTFPGYCSLGSQDNATRAVQTRLCDLGKIVTINGVFGPETAGAVRSFQAQKGLAIDGIVGPLTWNALWT